MRSLLTIPTAVLLLHLPVFAQSPELPLLLDLEHAQGQTAQQALATAEAAQSARTKTVAYLHLPYLARLAFVAGDFDKAKRYANEALSEAAQLRQPTVRTAATYGSHQVLGRILLRQQDLAGAKQELSASAETSGTPTERTFGPNMLFARELLQAGEPEAVLDFLEKVKPFWTPGVARINAWESAIRDGTIPDFDDTLRY